MSSLPKIGSKYSQPCNTDKDGQLLGQLQLQGPGDAEAGISLDRHSHLCREGGGRQVEDALPVGEQVVQIKSGKTRHMGQAAVNGRPSLIGAIQIHLDDMGNAGPWGLVAGVLGVDGGHAFLLPRVCDLHDTLA
ncbi:MAG: hypothetical protein FRX49_10120 [Trebouxia sp. A1-2]|nr:MAG: hypothetical protein FRX49_10120 [Trebouxia sp. A1-2]